MLFPHTKYDFLSFWDDNLDRQKYLRLWCRSELKLSLLWTSALYYEVFKSLVDGQNTTLQKYFIFHPNSNDIIESVYLLKDPFRI